MKRLILSILTLCAASFLGAEPAAAACPAASTGYPSVISATPGLVGYWRLEETTGTTACDATGTSDGTYKGAYTLGQPGAIPNDPDNKAVEFDGNAGFVDVPRKRKLDVGDNFTVEAWVKRNNPGTGRAEVIASKQTGAWLLMFEKDHMGDQLVLRQSRRSNIAYSKVRISDKNWHFVAATKDGPDIHLYVDGKDVTDPATIPKCAPPDEASPCPPTLVKGGNVNIGQSAVSDTSSFFDGTIDEVSVFDHALTAQQIADHYTAAENTPPPPPPPPASGQGVKAIWGTINLSDGRSAFPVYKDLGVQVFQYQISWKAMAPTKPADPRDPNDPAYRWPTDDPIKTAVSRGAANGISVALLVRQTPPWANGGSAQNVAPDNPQDYADFMTAARKEYPSVDRWMIWGESNRSAVWTAKSGDPMDSVHQYAQLLDAADHALKGTVTGDADSNTVIGGMTFTFGDADLATYPAHWIANLKLPDGTRPAFDEWGHNPFTHRCPDLNNPLSDDGARDISDLNTLREDLRVAFGQDKPLWLSEFSVSSDRGNRSFAFWVPRAVQAYWITRAFKVAGHVPGVSGLGWFNIADEDLPSNNDPSALDSAKGLTLGLLDTGLNPKPAYDAYKSASLADRGDPGACGSESDAPPDLAGPGGQAAAAPDSGPPVSIAPPAIAAQHGPGRPKITVSTKRKIRVRELLKRLRFTLRSSEAGRVTAVLRLDPSAARRSRIAPHAHRSVKIGGKRRAVPAGKRKIDIHFSKSVRRKLRRIKHGALTLSVSVRNDVGTSGVKKIRIRLRR